MKTAKPNPSASSASHGKDKSSHRKAQPREVAQLVKKPPAGGPPGSVETTPSDCTRDPSTDNAIILLDRFSQEVQLEDDDVQIAFAYNSAMVLTAFIKTKFPAVGCALAQDDDMLISREGAAYVLAVELDTIKFMVEERLLPMVAIDGEIRLRLKDVLDTAEVWLIDALITTGDIHASPAAEVGPMAKGNCAPGRWARLSPRGSTPDKAFDDRVLSAVNGAAIKLSGLLTESGRSKYSPEGTLSAVVSLADTAELLGVHATTISYLISRGLLPEVQMGRKVGVRLTHVREVAELAAKLLSEERQHDEVVDTHSASRGSRND